MTLSFFQPISTGQLSLSQVYSDLSNRTKNLVGDCAIAWANCGPITDMVSMLVIRVGLQFIAAWACPTLMLAMPRPVWDMVGVVIEKGRSSLKETAFHFGLQQSQDRNLALEMRVRGLVDQIGVFQMEKERLSWEKGQAENERDLLLKERESLILEKAPLLIERDQLREDKELLTRERDESREQKEAVALERDEVVRKQAELESSCHKALEELGELRILFDQLGDYKELNRRLTQFHEMYLQIAQEGSKGATLLALEELIPKYESHREKLHELVSAAIEELPENDSRRSILRGILRISQEEMGHIAKISETFHLLEELRKPIAEYFLQYKC